MKSLTVAEYLERTKTEKASEIAESVGVSPSTLSRRMTKLGYVYSNSGKAWNWEGEGEQPLQHDLLESVKVTQTPRSIHTRVTDNPPPVHVDVKKETPASSSEESKGYSQFTQEEVKAIKQLLVEWKDRQLPKSNKSLLELTRELPEEEKQRKTVIVLESVGKDLDELSKRERIDKSHLYNLALIEFFQKYK